MESQDLLFHHVPELLKIEIANYINRILICFFSEKNNLLMELTKKARHR